MRVTKREEAFDFTASILCDKCQKEVWAVTEYSVFKPAFVNIRAQFSGKGAEVKEFDMCRECFAGLGVLK